MTIPTTTIEEAAYEVVLALLLAGNYPQHARVAEDRAARKVHRALLGAGLHHAPVPIASYGDTRLRWMVLRELSCAAIAIDDHSHGNAAVALRHAYDVLAGLRVNRDGGGS